MCTSSTQKTITLNHYHHGALDVAVWDEASHRMGCRQWTCLDTPELGAFDDGDFDETPEQIDALLKKQE